jgi:hypothetical protein
MQLPKGNENIILTGEMKICVPLKTKADTSKQLRPIGKGEQVLEKRLDQKELT